MATFPIKKLQLDQEDFSKILIDVVKPFYERVNNQNAVLAEGCQDAPYFPAAISLGSENMNKSPVYKINAPGYFYRQHYKGNWNSSATAGVLISSTPSGMMNQSSRMVYLAGSDGKIGHANLLYPIIPGSSTYAYIVRSSVLDSGVTRDWCFVPTVFSASINIHPDSFVTPVGVPQITPNLTGTGGIVTASFSGNWKLGFKSVCGWNVVSEDAKSDSQSGEVIQTGIQFMTDADREEFISKRKRWISGLGAVLSDHGYGS